MKSNPLTLTHKLKGHYGFKKHLKQRQRKNPDAPKTRKELRKEKRKMKKTDKHNYLLKKFGREVEPVPKKKRRQQKKKSKSNEKSQRQNPRMDKGDADLEGSGSESESETSVPLKQKEDKLKKEMEQVRKKRLIEDNDEEDRTIRSLQKKLKLNKKALVPASFRVDGLDYLLDFCNELDAKKDSTELKSQKDPKNRSSKEVDEDDEDFEIELSSQDSENENQDELENDIESGSEKEMQSELEDECLLQSDYENDDRFSAGRPADEDDEIQEGTDEDDGHSDNCDSLAESPKTKKEEDTELWEDIYGRMRDREGNVVKDIQIVRKAADSMEGPSSTSAGKYVPPMKRHSQQRDKIKKSLKGLFNRLSESNMHSIATQVESFYMKNSRNEMNETLLDLMSAVLISPVISSDRIILEHVMLIGILHANVGTEVGAFFIQSFVLQFHKLYQEIAATPEESFGKELENTVLIISYTYHFKIVDCCLIYDILKLLGDSFRAKDVELILIILRSIGFRLRKDDPAALKGLIQLLQQKASHAQADTHGSRVKFMLEILLAIRNNNMTKIPNYDPSFGEHLLKIIKTFIHKGNYVSELKISLHDLLNADKKGRWWILGSAWTNTSTSAGPGDENSLSNQSNSIDDSSGPGILGNKKLLKKAKKLGMNTDTRRNIFYVLMTAEDYSDAFEKLNHLGLKNQLEREIIHVLIYCCLHEKKFNPYYALLASKFCALDRRFMLTTQYTLWDRLKEFPVPEPHHLKNVTELLIHLVKEKSLPLTVLKVIDFGDMPSWKLVFLKEVLGGILLQSSTEDLEDIFTKPGLSEKLHLFRDSIKLFMNHFMLNEQKVVMPDGESAHLMFTDPKLRNKLGERIELAEKALSLGHSKVQF